MYGGQEHAHNNSFGFQSKSYDNYQPYVGYNQNHSFGYGQCSAYPFGYSHTYQPSYGRYVSEQSLGGEDSYASNHISPSVAGICDKLQELIQQVEQDIRKMEKRLDPSSSIHERAVETFTPIKDCDGVSEPIRDLLGARQPSLRELKRRFYQLIDDGLASDEEVFEAKRALRKERDRRYSMGYDDDFEPFENPCNKDEVIPTPDHNNDRSPIQKVESWSNKNMVLDSVTYDDVNVLIENETEVSNIVEDPIEPIIDCNDDVDVETLVKAETNEELLQVSIEDHDVQEVSNSLEFYKDEENTITQELQGLSLPINSSPLPLIGLNVCASRILLNDFVSRYPPLESFDSHIMNVCKEETLEVPEFYVLYTLPSVDKNKCGGNFYWVIASLLLYCTNVCVKLLFGKQVTWKDPQLFRLLVYGARKQRKLQLQELEEIHNDAFESSRIYKEKTKAFHDTMISKKQFCIGQKVFLFNSLLHRFPDKLRSRWIGPFIVTNIFSHGAVEIRSIATGKELKVNGHRLKPYYENFTSEVVDGANFVDALPLEEA